MDVGVVVLFVVVFFLTVGTKNSGWWIFVAVNFARQIPHGLLLFFPSYPFMEKCVEHWQVCWHLSVSTLLTYFSVWCVMSGLWLLGRLLVFSTSICDYQESNHTVFKLDVPCHVHRYTSHWGKRKCTHTLRVLRHGSHSFTCRLHHAKISTLWWFQRGSETVEGALFYFTTFRLQFLGDCYK